MFGSLRILLQIRPLASIMGEIFALLRRYEPRDYAVSPTQLIADVTAPTWQILFEPTCNALDLMVTTCWVFCRQLIY